MIDLPALTLDALKAERESAASTPIVVDFWAPWCGSCRLLAPTVEKVAVELEGRARFHQVDVDAAPEMAQELGVMSVPTLLVFRNGQEVARLSGMKGRQALLDELTPHV